MKRFFCFPEILLITAILVPFVVIAFSPFNIDIHATTIVFGKTSWGFIPLFMTVFPFVLITWVIHLLARKYKWLPLLWRWTQVALSLLLWTTISYAIYLLSFDRPFDTFNPPAYEQHVSRGHRLAWSTLLLLLTQILFWITAGIGLIVSFVRRRQTANN